MAATEKVFAIPCPPFTLKLSPWDNRLIPIYSKRILCFRLANNDNERITGLLLAAFRATVEELPFLAGSVVPFSKDQPWLRSLRPQGAAYLEVKDVSHEINILGLRKAGFASALLDSEKLCPFPKSIYIEDGPIDVCRMRANFIDGGLLLVVHVIHTVCDGRGISDVLKIFAEHFRKAQGSEIPNQSIGQERASEDTYSFNRTSVLSSQGRYSGIEDYPAWTVAPTGTHTEFVHAKTICTNFHIGVESLWALKQAASPSPLAASMPNGQQRDSLDEITYISTHDAIAALVWRSIILARHRAGIIPSSTNSHFTQAVDCRSRLQLPQPYYGNAFYCIKTSLAIVQFLQTSENPDDPEIPSLQATARIIRGEVGKVTAEKFRDLLGYFERTEMDFFARLTIIDDLSFGSIFLISYFGFEMHELDFGEALGGHIEAFRVPSQGLAPGTPIVLPRLPDGSCEFVVNEREDVMRFLAEDEIFSRFVSKQS